MRARSRGKSMLRTDNTSVANPCVHIFATEVVQAPKSGTKSSAEYAVREGVHTSVKPPENNGEDIDTKQSGNQAVREGGESVRKIVYTHKGVSPERDGDTVCRMCAGKTVF